MELVFGVLNFLGLGGLAMFVIWVYKGLQQRIENLTKLAQEQKETLEAVRTRATELDQLRKDYKQGLEDFQHLGEKIKNRREEVIAEYESALQKKDEQLAAAKQLELKDLDLKQQSLDMIPQLQDRLAQTVEQMQRQLHMLNSVLYDHKRAAIIDYLPAAQIGDLMRNTDILLQPVRLPDRDAFIRQLFSVAEVDAQDKPDKK